MATVRQPAATRATLFDTASLRAGRGHGVAVVQVGMAQRDRLRTGHDRRNPH